MTQQCQGQARFLAARDRTKLRVEECAFAHLRVLILCEPWYAADMKWRMEWGLFATATLGLLGLGASFAAASNPPSLLAQMSFLGAAVIASFQLVSWGIHAPVGSLLRISIVGLCGALIAVVTVVSVAWAGHPRKSGNPTEPLLVQPSTIPTPAEKAPESLAETKRVSASQKINPVPVVPSEPTAPTIHAGVIIGSDIRGVEISTPPGGIVAYNRLSGSDDAPKFSYEGTQSAFVNNEVEGFKDVKLKADDSSTIRDNKFSAPSTEPPKKPVSEPSSERK